MQQDGPKTTEGKQEDVKATATPESSCWSRQSSHAQCAVSGPQGPHSSEFLPSSWEAEKEVVTGSLHVVLQNYTGEWLPGSVRGHEARSWHGCRLALHADTLLQNKISSL